MKVDQNLTEMSEQGSRMTDHLSRRKDSKPNLYKGTAMGSARCKGSS